MQTLVFICIDDNRLLNPLTLVVFVMFTSSGLCTRCASLTACLTENAGSEGFDFDVHKKTLGLSES